jgi:hypothetical protein
MQWPTYICGRQGGSRCHLRDDNEHSDRASTESCFQLRKRIIAPAGIPGLATTSANFGLFRDTPTPRCSLHFFRVVHPHRNKNIYFYILKCYWFREVDFKYYSGMRLRTNCTSACLSVSSPRQIFTRNNMEFWRREKYQLTTASVYLPWPVSTVSSTAKRTQTLAITQRSPVWYMCELIKLGRISSSGVLHPRRRYSA